MKQRIKWLTVLASLGLLVSCSSEEDIQPSGDNQNLTHITFQAGQSATRTVIDGSDATMIDWQEGETLSILDGSNTTRTFTLTEGAGQPTGTFEGMAQETSVYTAVYPQQEGLTQDGNSVAGMVLPDVQTATSGTFDPKANLMMARTTKDNTDLQFHNATAFIKVTPQMDCQQISIVNADEAQALAGTMTVTLDESKTISHTQVTAKGTHMVSLMGDIKAGYTYYIAVAPGMLARGSRLGITTADGKHYSKDLNKSATLIANKALNLGTISTDKTQWLPYVTFSAEAEQGVTLNDNSNIIQKMEYSVDYGKHWATFNVNQSYPFGQEKRIMLKGENPNGTGKDILNCARINFKNGNNVSCSGGIRTLIASDKFKDANTQDSRFTTLFCNCSQLVSTPELPATELAENCYEFMFADCSSLKEAPDLPATILKNNCYGYMFRGCTSLQKAPELRAKTLASHCYYGMFGGCINLREITMLGTSADKDNETNSLAQWLNGTTGGTLYVAKGISSSEYLKNNVPAGWVIKEVDQEQ